MNYKENNNNKEFLNRYAINLNDRAKEGKLDPVIGRDEQIRRVLQILSRRTKNNPILVGEPGVGKTAIVEDLANRIINLRNEFISITQFTELLKTKELTLSRISRCLLHIILNIKDCKPFTNTYAHVLGFRKNSSELFSILKETSQIPIITKLTVVDSLNDKQKQILTQDIYSSDLYESIVSNKYQRSFINEFTKQIVKY